MCPYISKDKRIGKCDEIVQLMKDLNIQPDGEINYILYKFCKDTVKPGYNNYKNYCGELSECVVEIRRRLLGPYEDSAILRNGDVE
jgi:hypothetical protein